MSGKWTATLIAFLAGLLGGTVPRFLFPERVAFAQNPQEVLQKYKEIPTKPMNVIRAERIELVNNNGKALAVLDVGYSEAFPAGAAKLAFTDRDEVFHQDRKIVLTTAQFSMSSGKEWSTITPGGGFSFQHTSGGGGIGNIPISVRPMTFGNGVNLYDSSGVVTLTGHSFMMSDKDGHLVTSLP